MRWCLGWGESWYLIASVLFQSLICQALFPRTLRSLVAKVSAFRNYRVFLFEDNETHNCIVQTWDEHELFCVCVHVETSGQCIPIAELAGLSRIVDSLASCQLPVSCQGGSPTLLSVLSENRIDGRQFVHYELFSEEIFMRCCYREAHQEVFGMLEVTTMVDFLMLRLRGALQEAWTTDVPSLRRCVVAGRVSFVDLRGVVAEVIPIWKTVREYVRFTGPPHLKSSSDRVS